MTKSRTTKPKRKAARNGRTGKAAPVAKKKASAPRTAAQATKRATKPAAKPTAKKASVDLQIGARLKHARLLAGVRMRELAARVGCTEGMISKIENARVVPSLPMLQRLVEALDRDLTSFFGSDPDAPGVVLRAGERPVASTDPIRSGRGVQYERLVPFGAGNLLEGNIHVVEPGGAKDDPITHQGETVGYLVQGRLELMIEDTMYELEAGDSFFFKNHLTNRYRNPGPGEARVLWVNTPQVH